MGILGLRTMVRTRPRVGGYSRSRPKTRGILGLRTMVWTRPRVGGYS